MGYAKLVITVVKYIPQVLVNYQRKSTVGWSIAQILCDFIGGVLSVTQLVIDSSLESDWSGITGSSTISPCSQYVHALTEVYVLGNPVKLWLGNVSILFDVVFILQHYVFYKHNEESTDESTGLLSGSLDT